LFLRTLFISVDASFMRSLLLLLCSGVFTALENSYESKIVVTVSNFSYTVIVVVVLVVLGTDFYRFFSYGELLKLLSLNSLVIILY
jgi:hypothetical protein